MLKVRKGFPLSLDKFYTRGGNFLASTENHMVSSRQKAIMRNVEGR